MMPLLLIFLVAVLIGFGLAAADIQPLPFGPYPLDLEVGR